MRDLNAVRGTNYIPSYAPDATVAWMEFDAEQIAFELTLARSAGFNSVRAWLSSEAYFANPAEFLRNFDQFLQLCRKTSLTAMPILFDSCGVERREAAPLLRRACELFEQFRRDTSYPEDVRKEWLSKLDGYIRRVAPHVRCEASGSATSLVWETWRANPGYSKLSADSRQRYHAYVDTIVESHRGDGRILAWDVMNEPWVTEIFLGNYDDPLPGQFARYFCEYILEKRCGVPITVGGGTLDRSLRLADCVDIISFHCYEPADKLQEDLHRAYTVCASYSKPVLLTECLANSALDDVESATDEGQVRVYERDIPVLVGAQIGWFQFCLMVGRAPFSYTGLFYANGVQRPAATLLAGSISPQRKA